MRFSGPIPPQTVRARMLLEIAEELVGPSGPPAKQLEIAVRERGASQVSYRISGDDSADAIAAVARGEVLLGVVNPSVLLTLASRGIPPFRGSQPVALVGVLPSPDRLVIALRAGLPVSSLEEAGEKRYPLRLSLRAQQNNSIHLVVDHVLQAAGWSLGDLYHWGGAVSYEEGLPSRGRRLAMAAAGEVDAIVDEGSGTWVEDAAAAGLRIAGLRPESLRRLAAWGYRTSTLSPEVFGCLATEVPTIDFSGFALFVRLDAPSATVETICAALEQRRERIVLQSGATLRLEDLVAGSDAAPLPVGFHPAAEAHWRKAGLLPG